MKDAKVIIRLEKKDLEILKKAADSKGLSVSAYVRMLILEKPHLFKIE